MIDIFGAAMGLLAILGALYAINARELMRGVLGLALFFIALAGFFGQLGAWYIAVGQLFLFVGGVVTLFVLAFNFTKTPTQRSSWFVAMLIGIAIFNLAAMFLPSSTAFSPFDLKTFATQFFVQYGWVLNVALLLLFSAVMSIDYLLEET